MRMSNHLLAAMVAVSGLVGLIALWCPCATAQQTGPAEPNVAADAAAEENMEVLMRGPLHEAFAVQISANPTPGVVVPKKPPEPVNEVPPEVRPEGDNVQWIPGYWAWDEEREDFIWVSGLWRNAPAGRRWLPGYWSRVADGYQWTSGAWVEADSEAVTYLPYPEGSLEQGPSSPAPSEDYFWVTGYWRYYPAGYRWRPGYWAVARAGWIWIPAHYIWTPRGCIFVPGYWDYRLRGRGVLFAPVYFRPGIYLHAGFRFVPSVVINTRGLFVHLFVRPRYHHYYFGDYYGPRYAAWGIYPWYEFRIGRRGYDPLLSYYIWHDARAGVDFAARLSTWHRYYQRHADLRPPHTLAALDTFTKRHAAKVGADFSVLGQPLSKLVAKGDSSLRLVRLRGQQHAAVVGSVGKLHQLAHQRLKIEGAARAVGRGPQTVRGVVSAPKQLLSLPRIENPLGVRHPHAPAVRTPRLRVPGVQRPDLRTPNIRTPNLRAPDIRAPSPRTLKLRAPNIPAPKFQGPGPRRSIVPSGGPKTRGSGGRGR